MKTIKLRRILVPIDFSPASSATLSFAKLIAARFDAKLHLLHVVAPAPIIGLRRGGIMVQRYSEKELTAGAQKRLQDLVSRFSLPPERTRSSVRVGQAAAEINQAAQKDRADLIAIATRV